MRPILSHYYHCRYNIKNHMFGLPIVKRILSEDEVLEIVDREYDMKGFEKTKVFVSTMVRYIRNGSSIEANSHYSSYIEDRENFRKLRCKAAGDVPAEIWSVILGMANVNILLLCKNNLDKIRISVPIQGVYNNEKYWSMMLTNNSGCFGCLLFDVTKYEGCYRDVFISMSNAHIFKSDKLSVSHPIIYKAAAANLLILVKFIHITYEALSISIYDDMLYYACSHKALDVVKFICNIVDKSVQKLQYNIDNIYQLCIEIGNVEIMKCVTSYTIAPNIRNIVLLNLSKMSIDIFKVFIDSKIILRNVGTCDLLNILPTINESHVKLEDLDKYIIDKLSKLDILIHHYRDHVVENMYLMIYTCMESGFIEMMDKLMSMKEFNPELLTYQEILQHCLEDINNNDNVTPDWTEELTLCILQRKSEILNRYIDKIDEVDMITEFNKKMVLPYELSDQDEFWSITLLPHAQRILENTDQDNFDLHLYSEGSICVQNFLSMILDKQNEIDD